MKIYSKFNIHKNSMYLLLKKTHGIEYLVLHKIVSKPLFTKI